MKILKRLPSKAVLITIFLVLRKGAMTRPSHQVLQVCCVILFSLLSAHAFPDEVNFQVSGKANLYQQTNPGTISGSINPVRVPQARLCPGQTIRISASSCVVDFGPRCTSPVGSGGTFRGLPVYSLIGRWSRSPDMLDNSTVASAPFFIGVSKDLVAPSAEGEYYLFLGENDGNFGDNAGAYTVNATWSQFSDCELPQITSRNKLTAKLGVNISQEFEVILGEPPYAWSLVDGELPTGMELSTDGVFNGTPTELGQSSFTAQVVDSVGDIAEKTFTVDVVLVLPPPDIRINKVGTTAVPGRTLNYFVVVENAGDTTATDLEITELVDLSQFSIVSATPNAEIVSLDEPASPFSIIVWRIPELEPGRVTVLFYKATLDQSIPFGTEVVGGPACHGTDFDKLGFCLTRAVLTSIGCTACIGVCSIGIPAGCINPAAPASCPLAILGCTSCMAACGVGVVVVQRCHREASSDCGSDEQLATGPEDPNEKLTLAKRFIQPDQTLTYPIHFENIGDVEALDVFVTDVLDPNLDESTLELLTPEGGFVDPITRTVRWELRGRNLQPGETDNVMIAIKPKPGLASGTEIRNKAEIQFEIFDSLVTEEVVNIIDTTLPSCVMDPLPEETPSLDVPISWIATDTIGEIEAVSIFVSTDGGVFAPFIEESTDSSSTFTGESGKTYGFFCVAKDSADNIEAEVPVAEATTKIVVASAVCEGDFDHDADVDGDDLAVFSSEFGLTNCPDCLADFDGDSDVDGSDLAVFSEDFGRLDCPVPR